MGQMISFLSFASACSFCLVYTFTAIVTMHIERERKERKKPKLLELDTCLLTKTSPTSPNPSHSPLPSFHSTPPPSSSIPKVLHVHMYFISQCMITYSIPHRSLYLWTVSEYHLIRHLMRHHLIRHLTRPCQGRI